MPTATTPLPEDPPRKPGSLQHIVNPFMFFFAIVVLSGMFIGWSLWL